MVNMWEQVRSNRRRSVVLVVLIAMLLFALGFVIGEAAQPGAGFIGLAVAGGVWALLSLVAYFQGDQILLAVSGAREIQKADHPRLFNVVEEMQIASGLPKMPRVYIVEDMALNAFATGRSPDNAAVAVTAGLLGRLNRDELQGVIAHEMSHVLHRDVLFMSMVGIMLGSIVMLSEVFLRGMFHMGRGYGRSRRYSTSRGGGGGGAQAVMVVAAVVLAILAPILAQFIYFAISRRREYLADANAAILTRYPPGLASALEAIAGDTNRLARATRATAPMYISNPLMKASGASGLMSTHPPIQDRIRILKAMAGGVSFHEYENAFRNVTGKGGVLPPSALGAAEQLAMRAPSDEGPDMPRERLHQAGDALRRANAFRFLTCQCGLRLKVPPDYTGNAIECPRCHARLGLS